MFFFLFFFQLFAFSWTGCSRDCGTGFKTRNRSCSKNDGCAGLSEEVAECNTNICPDNDNEKVLTFEHLSGRFSVCKIYGDPHVKRFDGTFINLLDTGNYTMVESRYLSDSALKTKYTVSISSDDSGFRRNPQHPLNDKTAVLNTKAQPKSTLFTK